MHGNGVIEIVVEIDPCRDRRYAPREKRLLIFLGHVPDQVVDFLEAIDERLNERFFRRTHEVPRVPHVTIVVVEREEDRHAGGIEIFEPSSPLIQNYGIHALRRLMVDERILVGETVAAVRADCGDPDGVRTFSFELVDERLLIARSRAVGIVRASIQEVLGISRAAEKNRSAILEEPTSMQGIDQDGARRRSAGPAEQKCTKCENDRAAKHVGTRCWGACRESAA